MYCSQLHILEGSTIHKLYFLSFIFMERMCSRCHFYLTAFLLRLSLKLMNTKCYRKTKWCDDHLRSFL